MKQLRHKKRIVLVFGEGLGFDPLHFPHSALQRSAAHWTSFLSNAVRLSWAGWCFVPFASFSRTRTVDYSGLCTERIESTVIGCCRPPCNTPSLPCCVVILVPICPPSSSPSDVFMPFMPIICLHRRVFGWHKRKAEGGMRQSACACACASGEKHAIVGLLTVSCRHDSLSCFFSAFVVSIWLLVVRLSWGLMQYSLLEGVHGDVSFCGGCTGHATPVFCPLWPRCLAQTLFLGCLVSRSESRAQGDS